MTIRYASEFATNSSLGCFAKLLLRWRGSVYKFVWREYLVFLTLYFIISAIYRFTLDEDEKRSFEKIANFCEKAKDSFRLYFVLGFFVTSIVSKWWKMYDIIPTPDPIAHYVYASIRGDDEPTKELRKSIVRQSCLSLMLTFLTISPPLKRKYPTLDDLIKEEMLTADEKKKLEKVGETTRESEIWLPISWATDLVVKANEDSRVNQSASSKIFDQLDKLRSGCGLLLEYEHNSVPLAYVQVVAISVYTYFFSCLLGRQWLEKNNKFADLDLYFPFLTTLEFFFYMGWLKVAESMINPFGGDDDDFELEEIVKRNLQVTSAMVNGTLNEEDSADSNHDDDANNKAAVTHYFKNETVINCNSTLDPEQIPLSSLPETDDDDITVTTNGPPDKTKV